MPVNGESISLQIPIFDLMNVKLTNKHKIKVNGADDIFQVMRHILLRDNKVDREKEHFFYVTNQIFSHNFFN